MTERADAVHIVAIGDIGPLDDMIHIGDEAMFDEAVRQLRQRGVDRVTAVTANPADTTRRYGVTAVSPAGPNAGSDDEVLDSPLGAALRDADAVLVTGGGNLSSLWPTHIIERARLARLAERLAIPFVITGQTLGPVLDDGGRHHVGRMLRSARLVGTRERPSFELARELGVASAQLGQTIDDASFLGHDHGIPVSPEPIAVVTIARHTGETSPDAAATAYAEFLDTVADVTGLDVVFHAHFASLRADATTRGDTAVHERIMSMMRSRSIRIEATTDAPAAARLARSAQLVVSSRYHPAVFAASGAVPTIGIPVDEYTNVKLRGALGAVGQSGILPISELVSEGGRSLLEEVWTDRGQIEAQSQIALVDARSASTAWWDRVGDALAAIDNLGG